MLDHVSQKPPLLLDKTALAAQESARRAASRLFPLFGQFHHISLDDLIQHALTHVLIEGITRQRYDISKSAWTTYAYMVARNRIMDMRSALLARPRVDLCEVSAMEEQSADLHTDAGADSGVRLATRRRGRPWKYPLPLRCDCVRRRLAGESVGSIALRHRITRSQVQRITQKSVYKFRRA